MTPIDRAVPRYDWGGPDLRRIVTETEGGTHASDYRGVRVLVGPSARREATEPVGMRRSSVDFRGSIDCKQILVGQGTRLNPKISGPLPSWRVFSHRLPTKLAYMASQVRCAMMQAAQMVRPGFIGI